MSVWDSLVTQVVEDSFDDILGLDSQGVLSRFGGHVLHCQNIHVLVLVAQVLREYVRKRLRRCEHWQILDRPVCISWCHIYNRWLLWPLLHVRSQKSAHEHQWERIGIDCAQQFLISALVEFFTLWITFFDIVDKNGYIVGSSDLVFDVVTQLLIILPVILFLVVEIELEHLSVVVLGLNSVLYGT